MTMSMMDVLIVKSDKDRVTKFANEILDRCSNVLPAINITRRSLVDTSGDKHTVRCKKLLFLVTDERTSVVEDVSKWVEAVFPNLKDITRNVLVVYEPESNADVKFEISEAQKPLSLRTIVVKPLKGVFQWWPQVLDFIYQRKPTGERVFLKTDVGMTRVDDESESVDVEQSKLKQDINDLLHFNKAVITEIDDELMLCKLVIVVFGRTAALSASVYSALRLAKINGIKVLFFSTHELQFSKEMKRISTIRYKGTEHMEGILFIVRKTAMKKYKLPPMRKPVIPQGPVTILNVHDAATGQTKCHVSWRWYAYGLGETISIQTLRKWQTGSKVWEEIADTVQTNICSVELQIEGPLSAWMSNYRLVCEDRDGFLSRGIKAQEVVKQGGLSSRTRSDFGRYKPDDDPVHMKCPFCKAEIDTVSGIQYSCILCCRSKNFVHVCPNCNRTVRMYNGRV